MVNTEQVVGALFFERRDYDWIPWFLNLPPGSLEVLVLSFHWRSRCDLTISLTTVCFLNKNMAVGPFLSVFFFTSKEVAPPALKMI